MTSTIIHAGIPSSAWANPPKIPPYIHFSLLGNLILLPARLLRCGLHSFFSFLQYAFIGQFVHIVSLPFLRLCAAFKVVFQRLITVAAKGDL